MSKALSLAVGVQLLVCSMGACQEGEAKKPDAAEELNQLVRAYTAAFNKHDAGTVAAFWTPNAVYTDRQTGERTEGRDAIRKDIEELFAQSKAAKLAFHVDSVRFIKPDVATLEGQTTLSLSGEKPAPNTVSAVLVKQDGNWLIDSASESPVVEPQNAAEALRQLEWMVGQWVDDAGSERVETTARWSPKQTFLIRSYVVRGEGEIEDQGTQVIGWDAKNKRIRSWTFDSDGSFNEATWSKDGNEWVVRMTGTLEDGSSASGIQIIKKIDDNTITVRKTAQELNGEPQPSEEPVKVRRVAEPAAAAAVPAPPAPAN